MRNLLIINADDFGLDGQTNKAVIQSFKRGLCSSATLMPNMPGFKEACQLAHENKLIEHTGLHLVLRDGCPLTEKIKHLSRFCDKNGLLCLSRANPNFPIFSLTNSEKEVLAEEIKAQIERCRAYGIPLTHIDSHYDLHIEWSIAKILIPIAKEKDIPYIRIPRNCGLNFLTYYKKVYKYILNYKIRSAGFARTKYFGSIEDFIYLKKRGDWHNNIKSFEIMIHPGFNDEQVLVDCGNSMEDRSLEQIIKEVDPYKKAVSFSGARYLLC